MSQAGLSPWGKGTSAWGGGGGGELLLGGGGGGESQVPPLYETLIISYI